jgi:hypothetical protein
MGSGHDLQRGRDVAELPLAELAGEVFSDASKMSSRGLAEGPAAPISQLGEHHPSVSSGAVPPHEPLFNEPIDGPSEAARGHHDAFGELAHLEGSTGNSGQAKKYVVAGHRQAVLGPELQIQRSGHLVVGMQKRLPGAEFRLAEIG